MKTIKQILTEARDLIADPEHWTQGSYAIENNGEEIYPDESHAYAFCSLGALAKVTGTRFDVHGDMRATDEYALGYGALATAAHDLFGVRAVASVNDGEAGLELGSLDDPLKVAHENTIAMFDKAIANCVEA